MWTLTVPDWTPALLNSFVGAHWGKMARLKRQDAEMVKGYAMFAGVPAAFAKRWVRITVYGWPRGTLPDDDAVLKSLLDALVTAELLEDDSAAWCEWDRPKVVRSAVRKTVIELSETPWADGQTARG